MPCIHIHVSREDNKASGTEITDKVIIEENFSKKKKEMGNLIVTWDFMEKKSHI